MVGLAKKYKDDPLHIIASYCQRGSKDPALEFLKSKGWDEEKMTNMSVMYQTRYTNDGKITYVPYYLIFDHTGKLRYHHMAGPYHGGNGDKYQKQVAELLKEVPKKELRDPNAPLTKLRGWKNAEGKTIEAALLSVKDGKAKLRMRDGRVYNYPLEKLSKESQKEIEELVEKP